MKYLAGAFLTAALVLTLLANVQASHQEEVDVNLTIEPYMAVSFDNGLQALLIEVDKWAENGKRYGEAPFSFTTRSNHDITVKLQLDNQDPQGSDMAAIPGGGSMVFVHPDGAEEPVPGFGYPIGFEKSPMWSPTNHTVHFSGYKVKVKDVDPTAEAGDIGKIGILRIWVSPNP